MNRVIRKWTIQILVILASICFLQFDDWSSVLFSRDVYTGGDVIQILTNSVFQGMDMDNIDIETLIRSLFPVILFGVFYGDDSYQDLRDSGIYYFVRYISPMGWFVRKHLRLLRDALIFQSLYVGGMYLCALWIGERAIHIDELCLVGSYVVYWAMISYFTVIVSNMLAFWLGWIVGFVLTFICLLAARSLVVSVGNELLPGLQLPLRALLPLNLQLTSDGHLQQTTEWSVTMTGVYTVVLLVIFAVMINCSDVGLRQEEYFI